jgi:hypothetical protein
MRTMIPLLLAALMSAAPHAAEKDHVLATLQEAEAQHAAALAREHGWSVTEPLMEEAREALARGDVAAAGELAERALLMAQQSVLQAEREAGDWQGRVLGK